MNKLYESIASYLWHVFITIDQAVNTILGPILNFIMNPVYAFGDPDETLSSVFGKNVELGSCRACHFMCRILHFFDTNHCKKSIEIDETSAK